MCGRTGLSLDRGDLRCACSYKPHNDSPFCKPVWSDEYNNGKTYSPSSNIAPTDITPILLSSQHFEQSDSNRILKPMMWGMIPPWHKGECTKHGLSTNNCRVENIFSSKLYGPALREGKRCVVVAEGFYEWQTTDKTTTTKQPYFVYSPQSKNIQIDNPATWTIDYDEMSGWKGVKLLRMAGLYNVWRGPHGPVYSYSIITLKSCDSLNWLHHRMPAILDDDAIVEKWLDSKNISGKDAVSCIKPVENVAWHPVSTLVNNSRNKSKDLNKRISLNKKQDSSQKVMTSWLCNKTIPNKTCPNSLMTNWLMGKPAKRKSEEPCTETKRTKLEQDE